ncbi:META domain-containing protein [uncultured Dokdonia sp.]|uniref:META domain-containing protein n=1 Tax=uncultured Dokdonia sp. TaxID=575653 RepID=UPI00260B940B|nr:META domain-containing protein [uncultured Dokdonia sp.]
MKTVYLLFSTILFFSACNSAKTDTKKSILKNETYTIIKLIENNVSSTNMSITFNEETSKISGNTGCNSYFGDYTYKDNTISFSGVGATKKYCPKISKIEKLLLNTLKETTQVYKNATDEILFKNSDDKVVIIAKLQ